MALACLPSFIALGHVLVQAPLATDMQRPFKHISTYFS
ncbi:hypothetical protein CWRG_00998 [Chthonomonas calidirosea]|nr:hypothetical protein CWRG_00998 [Chthonomonas calidirosea]